MVQIITYNKAKYSNFSEKYKISQLDEFESFDDHKINIIDLSDEMMWYYENNTSTSLNNISDLHTLSKEIETSKNCKVLIVLPQNCNFTYDKSPFGEYRKNKKIKDMLSSVLTIISNHLIFIKGMELSYSKSNTTFGDSVYKSDFNFNEINPKAFTSVTKSENSNKNTTILYNNMILTTLNIFETEKHVSDFIHPFLIDNTKKRKAPDWIEHVEFYDDKKLKNNKEENNEKIRKLQDKNNEIDLKLENNNELKSILYSTGDELVTVVMKMLDDMLDNDSSKFKDKKLEDFLIKKDTVTFIGEIKGVSGAVTNQYVSQLDVHVQGYTDKINKENLDENIKGLLIINPQRNKNITERNEVQESQIKIAKRNGALIIECYTLLKLYEKYLNKELETNDIINLLTDKVGILLEKDIKSK